MKGEAIGRGDGETGMGVPCSLDCFLLSRDIDIFEDPRKLGCLPSPGRADCLTCYPGSVGLSGARDVQAADVCEAEQFVKLDHLGLVTLKLSGMQILREYMELVLEQSIGDLISGTDRLEIEGKGV